ncbi:DUF5333 family protein [Szabonella alba]|uniref:DUF5333 domain-containing protein n=1 Tax=Szabonella alba TaxID=2804194 RepID=A0A8K0Y0Z6_9RHOB|nr:DUF5333 family protein [Szabonella alba]MBL4917357.1 hypothetical protein [Szabonella alba]
MRATARMAVLALMAGLAAPLAADARSLRDVRAVDDGLTVVAIGNAIRKTCPQIEARRLRAMGYMRGLADLARQAGFSEEEIRAHVEDRAEKARVKAAAAAYLAAQGAKEGDVPGHCAAGRAEIERNSQVGRLLRVN